jgi:hypothetical protein
LSSLSQVHPLLKQRSRHCWVALDNSAKAKPENYRQDYPTFQHLILAHKPAPVANAVTAAKATALKTTCSPVLSSTSPGKILTRAIFCFLSYCASTAGGAGRLFRRTTQPRYSYGCETSWKGLAERGP